MSQDLAKGIEGATTVLKSIPDFIKAFTEIMQTPYGWIFLAIIFLWFVLNKDLAKLFSLFESKEKKRLDKLEIYVSDTETANSEALEVIKDLRDAYYFKVATDIYAEKNLRDSLISLHKKTSHTITWVNIKRAMPYIDADSKSNISIREQNWQEKIGYFYNLSIGWLFLGFLIASSLVYMFSSNKDLSQSGLWLTSTLFCTFFTIFSFSQNFPISSAKKIKAELEKTVNNSPEKELGSTDEK